MNGIAFKEKLASVGVTLDGLGLLVEPDFAHFDGDFAMLKVSFWGRLVET